MIDEAKLGVSTIAGRLLAICGPWPTAHGPPMTHSKSVLCLHRELFGLESVSLLFFRQYLTSLTYTAGQKNVMYDSSSYSSTFARLTFEAPLSHEIETKDCSSCLARIICFACYLSSWHVQARQLEQSLVSISALRCRSSDQRNGRIFYSNFVTGISFHLYGASLV